LLIRAALLTQLRFSFVFFYNDPAPTDIYTLSLHDALPIWKRVTSGASFSRIRLSPRYMQKESVPRKLSETRTACASPSGASCSRSEEHTSELQSRRDLVCRLLLEKKKKEKKAR